MTPAQKNSPAHEAGQSSKQKTILTLIRKAFNAIVLLNRFSAADMAVVVMWVLGVLS